MGCWYAYILICIYYGRLICILICIYYWLLISIIYWYVYIWAVDMHVYLYWYIYIYILWAVDMHGRTPTGLTPPSDPSDGCGAVPDPAHSLHRSYFLLWSYFVLYWSYFVFHRSYFIQLFPSTLLYPVSLLIWGWDHLVGQLTSYFLASDLGSDQY